MLLGGLRHGASWSFVIWGALHGVYLMINHAFRATCAARDWQWLARSVIFRALSWALTMLAVVVAWVLFRSETLGGAVRMLESMAGRDSGAGDGLLLWNAGLDGLRAAVWCLVLGATTVLLPNSNRIGTWLLATAQRRSVARDLMLGFATAAALFLVLVNTARDAVSPFIYFNF